MFSWLLSRDDDLEAAKFEKMLFESLRGFGDAGDCGTLWKAAGGMAKSDSSGMFGDLGLLGLMGALALSFPALPRIASDSVDDLGIFLSVFCGGIDDW